MKKRRTPNRISLFLPEWTSTMGDGSKYVYYAFRERRKRPVTIILNTKDAVDLAKDLIEWLEYMRA